MDTEELLRQAGDNMLGKMLQSDPQAEELDFNIDLAGKGYKVYYERHTEDGRQVWRLVGYEEIGG